jgi:hypothetical protein
VLGKEEIGELAHKADEKVTVFEQALKAAKPLLDDGVFQNHSDAAAEAHKIIRALDKNGPTVYALVALITTLDDLVIDARVDMTNILITMVNFQAGGKTVPSAAISMVNGLETQQLQTMTSVNE